MFGSFGILDLSTPDLFIILAIVLLLFGAKKLPELSRSLGSSARELKKGFNDIQEVHSDVKEQVKQVTAELTPAARNASAISRQQPSERPIVQG